MRVLNKENMNDDAAYGQPVFMDMGYDTERPVGAAKEMESP